MPPTHYSISWQICKADSHTKLLLWSWWTTACDIGVNTSDFPHDRLAWLNLLPFLMESCRLEVHRCEGIRTSKVTSDFKHCFSITVSKHQQDTSGLICIFTQITQRISLSSVILIWILWTIKLVVTHKKNQSFWLCNLKIGGAQIQAYYKYIHTV